MDCSNTRLLISLYLSSELDPYDAAAFDIHVQQCRACASELESIRHCDDLLREACRELPVDGFEVRQRVRREIDKTSRRSYPATHAQNTIRQMGGEIQRRLFFLRQTKVLLIAAAFILAVLLGVAYLMISASSHIVYAAALDDHYEEVVKRASISGWHESTQEIRVFVQQELGDATFLDDLTPSGYQLAQARLCNLDGNVYVHLVYRLVYRNDARQISIYIKRRDADLPGATVEVVNNCPLHTVAINEFEITGFQSPKYTVLLVSDLPHSESLQIARAAALKIETKTGPKEIEAR